jgi:hypothetical protein
MRSQPDTALPTGSSRTSSVRISRPWVTLARGVWVVCALLLLANFLASIPAYSALLHAVCTLPDPSNCATGQLTPNTAKTLAYLHLSLSRYATLFVAMEVLLSLLPWCLGLLIFWRKSDEWMGLFVSLLLVLFGGTGTINTLLGLWAPSQPSPLLSHLFTLISGAEWIGLGAFLLTFPTGRFVPRWSWLVLSCWIVTFVWNAPTTFLVQVVQGLATLVVYAGTLIVIVYRYARVFDVTGRQQAKWFVYAVVVSITLLVLGTSLPSVVTADSPSQLLFPAIILVSGAIFYLGLGCAILRYRLWDIDLLINRTLVYGTLTVLLSGVYIGLVIGLQALLRGMSRLRGPQGVDKGLEHTQAPAIAQLEQAWQHGLTVVAMVFLDPLLDLLLEWIELGATIGPWMRHRGKLRVTQILAYGVSGDPQADRNVLNGLPLCC